MTTETATNRQPALRAYVVTGDGENAIWIAVGAAWTTRNGEGYTVQLDALPTNGRLVLMPPRQRD